MRPKHTPIYDLTITEKRAEEARQEDPRCRFCQNGFKVFEIWTCDTNKTWPNCNGKVNGYTPKNGIQ